MNPPKILVVEPKQDVAHQLLRIIAGLGYRTVAVAEGSDVSTTVRDTHPDLAVLGNFGNSDALSVAENLRLDFKLPLLLIADSIDRALIERYKAIAPEGVMPRLVNDPAIELAVELALQRSRSEEQREDTIAALIESETQFRGIFTTAADGVVISDQAGLILLANPQAEALLGYGEGELLGQSIEVLVPERLREAHRHHRADYAPSPLPRPMGRGLNIIARRKDGSEFPADISLSALHTSRGTIITSTLVDISAKVQAEKELKRLNRTLKMLSACNRVLVLATKETDLLDTICRHMIEIGGYAGVWVGYAEQDEARTVRPITRAGMPDDEFAASLYHVTWADTKTGRGPTGTAIRTGQVVVVHDLHDDPRFAPWRETIIKFELRSAASLPLKAADKVFGAISIYTRVADALDDQEVTLLRELADDLAYGIMALREAAERRRATEELILSQHAIDSSNDGIVITDSFLPDRAISYVNPAFERITGYSAAEAVGRNARFLLGEDKDQIGVEELRAALREQRPAKVVLRNFHKNGRVFWNELSLAPVRGESGQVRHFVSIINDITERKAAETKIQRLTQFYAALSQCNEAIVRSTSEDELFPQICRSAVEYGGMKMAWIGMVDETSKLVKPVVSCGEGTEYLEGIRISVEANDPYASGPAGKAIRNKQPQWFQDFQHDMHDTPWHERAARFGWGSAASLPLLRNGVVIGAFTLYAGDTNAFDDAARMLLVEMAADISFALDGFDRETERKHSEQVLAESEQRFRGVVEQTLTGIYIIQDGRFVYVNPRFAEIFGYASAGELVGVEPALLVAEQDRSTVAENISSRIDNGVQSLSYGFTGVRKDGSQIEVGVHGAWATHDGRPAIIGLMQDVSEKKHDEERIQRYVTQLEHSFMNTIEVATTLLEMRDPYTAGHEKRVALIAVAIATELGLDAHRIEGMRVGGYIHDIGKIIVPSEILTKPGRLTAAEYELMKGHPQAGYDILKKVDFPWPVADIAYQHHERMDGSGYPRGLKGEEILLEARITAVADVVEAMASHRPYRPGLGIEQALAEIERGSGTLYDPVIAGICLRLFREQGFVLPAH